jgi:hypothetical protein
MPTPDFVLALRQHVGHPDLWLPGETGVTVTVDELPPMRQVLRDRIDCVLADEPHTRFAS